MTILRKQFWFVILPLVGGLLGFYAAPRDTALGIHLGATLYAGQSVLDNFQYRLWMRNTLHGDASALETLVKFDCGGGAGCYDHGEVLVQLLSQAGDLRFSSMVRALPNEARYDLRSLLDAGFEYGSSVKMDGFWFMSTRFAIEPGEDDEINPRIYGNRRQAPASHRH